MKQRWPLFTCEMTEMCRPTDWPHAMWLNLLFFVLFLFSGVPMVQFLGGTRGGTTFSRGACQYLNILYPFWGPIFSKFWIRAPGGTCTPCHPHSYATIFVFGVSELFCSNTMFTQFEKQCFFLLKVSFKICHLENRLKREYVNRDRPGILH